jgi:hypothetical protein
VLPPHQQTASKRHLHTSRIFALFAFFASFAVGPPEGGHYDIFVAFVVKV